MLRFTTGDMFETPADLRVNTVNCVGVMGAGVALAFKNRYPEMFRDYKRACDAGQVHPGELHVWKNLMGDWVVNFPTKRHWREKSKYEDIEAGLTAFRKYLQRQGPLRVTLPALGCGHGGLDWERVAPMIKDHLDGIEAEIFVFAPADSRAVGQQIAEESFGKLHAVREADADFPASLTHFGVHVVYSTGESRGRVRADVAIALSPKPSEREETAALSFVDELAKPGVTIGFVVGTATSTKLASAALARGAHVAAWVPQGLLRFHLPRALRSAFDQGNLSLLSIAGAEQGWNPQLARRSTLASLTYSRANLVTDPEPSWLSEFAREASPAEKSALFYIRYQKPAAKYETLWTELSARAVGRRSTDGRPNVEPILNTVDYPASKQVRAAQANADYPQAGSPVDHLQNHAVSEQVIEHTSKMRRYPKRLIEVDLPIKRISAHARREKSIRHGHISTLHIWWARRPLAACRAVICAALWPDPAGENCPSAFVDAAKKEMLGWTKVDRQMLLSAESRVRFEKARQKANRFDDPLELRHALLDFIADFANWDSSTVQEYLDTSRGLTQAAHEALGGAPGTRPLVVDPFCGGGSIPLEALRVGADAFASDLNPVPVLLNKVVLEYIPKYGQRLADEVRKGGEWIQKVLADELGQFYEHDQDNGRAHAFIWARTILSEAPGDGAIPVEVPLLRSMVLLNKRGRCRVLRWKRDSTGRIETLNELVEYADGRALKVRRPQFEIVSTSSATDAEEGTSSGGAATCPVTGFTTSVERVREQLKSRRGGAADARLVCVVTSKRGTDGKQFILPTKTHYESAGRAKDELAYRIRNHSEADSLLPDGNLNHLRGFFNIVLYGMTTWSDLYSPRQALGLSMIVRRIREVAAHQPDSGLRDATQTCLALALDRCADKCASLVGWDNSREMVSHVFTRQALPMIWDFAEVNLLSENGWQGATEWVGKVLIATTEAKLGSGTAANASATDHPLPSDVADAVITDPPYYAAIPYADLSDFFYTWLKRSIGHVHTELFQNKLSPKDDECVSLAHRAAMYRNKDNAWFEQTMTKACAEGRRITKLDGIAVIVFANKETEGWEAMLSSLISAGWVITASWPIDTEMGNRMRAQNSATLASSVHLVCRPHANADNPPRPDEIGDWRDVLQELPRRIHEWMPRLAEEGVVGADAIFACLGPALEIFSRCKRVERADGSQVSLREYLEHVWAAVSKEALSMVFAGADATGFEEDSRLTAMWLWTLNAGGTSGTPDTIENDPEGDDNKPTKKKPKGGFTLEYDAARKIAQGLGAHLEDLKHLVEISGDTARLLPVSERTTYLFGKDQDSAPVAPKGRKKDDQLKFDLFQELTTAPDAEIAWGEKAVTKPGETTLDRIHQSMILFAAGRGEALRRFLVDDSAGRDQRFWRLAQALSALYPKASDEKRWIDGVLARKKGLGL